MNGGKWLPAPAAVICAGGAPSAISSLRTRLARRRHSRIWPARVPAPAVLPSRLAWRARPAASQRAIGVSAVIAAAGSVKAVLSGSNRTGDSPGKLNRAAVAGVTWGGAA